MSDLKELCVAIDDGYDQVKVCFNRNFHSIPSRVKQIEQSYGFGLSSQFGLELEEHQKQTVIEIDDLTYSVGESISDPIDTRYDDFPFDNANLALAVAALIQSGVNLKKVQCNVVAGLPLNRYFNNKGEMRKDLVEMKSKAWMRPVKILDQSTKKRNYIVSPFNKILIAPEAMGAYYDYVLGANANVLKKKVEEQVVIVDVGGRTTDIALASELSIDRGRSGTCDFGMLWVYDQIRKEIEDKLDLPGGSITIPSVFSSLNKSKMTVQGKKVDIRPLYEKFQKGLVEQILRFVKKLISGRETSIDKIIFVGGGTNALGEALLSKFPSDIAMVAENPGFANVRGMYKLASKQFK